jgi:hypothetical protein
MERDRIARLAVHPDDAQGSRCHRHAVDGHGAGRGGTLPFDQRRRPLAAEEPRPDRPEVAPRYLEGVAEDSREAHRARR